MWRKFSRSELLSTFFPTWIWQGREWSKGRIPKYDPYFWINAHSHPVLSTYYPPSAIGAFASSFYEIGVAWKVLLSILAIHIGFSFLGWYIFVESFSSPFVAIFASITFVLSGYNWKQQPCFIYTIAWFPWLLTGIATHSILLTSIAF